MEARNAKREIRIENARRNQLGGGRRNARPTPRIRRAVATPGRPRKVVHVVLFRCRFPEQYSRAVVLEGLGGLRQGRVRESGNAGTLDQGVGRYPRPSPLLRALVLL